MEGDAVEGFADEVDVFFLPGRVFGRGEDGEFFGQFRIEGDGFALVFFLLLRRFGGGDVRGGGAYVVAGGGVGGFGGRDGGPEFGLDGGGLGGSGLEIVGSIMRGVEDGSQLTLPRTSCHM